MPPSDVFFIDFRASMQLNILAKLNILAIRAGLEGMIEVRNLVALKLHFGEKGNTGFIRPLFIRALVNQVKALGALPFLTDTNTLYAGSRGNSVSHMVTSIENGFAYSVVGAPVVIADGLRGASYKKIEINQETIQTAFVGKEIAESDAIISIAHFKGHELSGFGGTLKNLGMGCAARKGKLQMHSKLSPVIKRDKCVGCGFCADHCAQGAIRLENKKATMDTRKCVGCGECILICPEGLITIKWSNDMVLFQKKMAEYALAALTGKRSKSLFFNFLSQITPACDCAGYSDAPIVGDIGILASRDPVAIDQAAADLVNKSPAAQNCALHASCSPGEDKFKALYTNVNWEIQLKHAEKIGLGSRKYRLVTVEKKVRSK